MMSTLGAEILAPGHTLPIFGAAEVKEALVSTCDAILHVMTQTARGMDEGQSLDDICASLTLPDRLADKPYLQEFYGRLDWSARAFAAGTLGWYDGNPTNLSSISSKERAMRMAALAGGEDALMAAAEQADQPRWRLELCDHLIALGKPAQLMKAETYEQLAETEINATARNTYIWAAQEIRNQSEGG